MAIEKVGDGRTSIPNEVIKKITEIYKNAVSRNNTNCKTITEVDDIVANHLDFENFEDLPQSIKIPVSIAKEVGIEDGIAEFFKKKDLMATDDDIKKIKDELLQKDDIEKCFESYVPSNTVKVSKKEDDSFLREWIDEDKLKLSDMFRTHTPIKAIAKAFGVSEDELQAMFKKVGFTVSKDYSKPFSEEQLIALEWKNFSEHLKFHRKKRNITCDEFSKKIEDKFGITEGFSRCTLNNWERNLCMSKLDFEKVNILAETLNDISPLSVYDLFSSKDGFKICLGGTLTEKREELKEKKRAEKEVANTSVKEEISLPPVAVDETKDILLSEEERKVLMDNEHLATLKPMAKQVVATMKKESEEKVIDNSGLSLDCVNKVTEMANANGLTFMETLEAIIETTPITRKFRVKKTYEVED